jgi:hypothetical protein
VNGEPGGPPPTLRYALQRLASVLLAIARDHAGSAGRLAPEREDPTASTEQANTARPPATADACGGAVEGRDEQQPTASV